jgi:hypothetical protein
MTKRKCVVRKRGEKLSDLSSIGETRVYDGIEYEVVFDGRQTITAHTPYYTGPSLALEMIHAREYKGLSALSRYPGAAQQAATVASEMKRGR